MTLVPTKSMSIFCFRRLALFLAVILSCDTVLVPLSQAQQYEDIWEQRRRAESSENTSQLAALPTSPFLAVSSEKLLGTLPTVQSIIPNDAPGSPDSVRKRGQESSLRRAMDAIPSSHALIKEISPVPLDGKNSVVLIQDIHMNAEAQANIAETLLALVQRSSVTLIGLEGAYGPLDFRTFRAFGDQQAVLRVLKSYLEAGDVGGPSYLGATVANLPPLLGVDHKGLYDRNVSAYRKAHDQKRFVEEALEKEWKTLEDRRRRVLTDTQRRLDALRVDYRLGRMGLGAYAKQLASLDKDMDFVLERFLMAYDMESRLDFHAVERERKTVIEKLTARLTPAEADWLMEQSLSYRAGTISYATFYRALRDVCAAKGIGLKATPAFDDYIRYVMLSDGIQGDELFAALDRLEGAVFRTVFPRPAQKQVALRSEFLALVEKLIDFELTPQEWERYGMLQDAFPLPLTAFEAFYVFADARSHEMARALLTAKGDAGTRVLVAGGFHTPLLTQRFRANKTPYAVVTPRLKKIDTHSGSAYLSVFNREKTPLDKLFLGEKLFMNPEAAVLFGGNQSSNQTTAGVVAATADTVNPASAMPRDVVSVKKGVVRVWGDLVSCGDQSRSICG